MTVTCHVRFCSRVGRGDFLHLDTCTTVRTLSSRRVSSQRPYDVITVLDTWIQKFY
ncbi:hypothetical protein [Wolbachia endosymbiont of Drosophila pseudotakahashii]|uniref:hypothetical protein n=1 Tax=Wolbachia endosymbiont of Drosophila pseudotakahashii TaxID=375919 RepID=UPI00222F14B4|nr:hypothetical protein [Wolbachia endosymbiont of Drosophila pseudotakahashii]UZE38230.1 hypothetical protein ONI09_04960 [Wolbachia endosymbiont of Drosophila pseudotakahashii]